MQKCPEASCRRGREPGARGLNLPEPGKRKRRDPLICQHCGAEMKLIALIDDQSVIEKILRHLKLWPEQTAPACLSRAPPSIPPPDGGERIVELCFDDPFPDYDTEPVMAYANDPEFAA